MDMHISIYIYQNNGGLSNAVNAGLKKFSGKYFMLADSDDILEPDCVLKKVKYLENHPDKGLVSAKARIVDERNLETTLGYSYNKSTNWCEDVVFTNKAVCTCGIYMLRSENFLQIYPQRHIFDSRAGQNYQILVPMSYYFKYGQIDDIVYNYVVRQNSLSHQKINIKDTYNRFDEFIKILENTTKCLPENYRKSYMKKVYEHFAVQKLHSSLKQNDVNITNAALENLKKFDINIIIKIKCLLKYWRYRIKLLIIK